MTVRDDLVAARAMIDTPEKWGRITRFDIAGGKLSANAAIKIAAEHPDYDKKNVDNWAERYWAMHGAIEAAWRRSSSRPYDLAQFNNDPATTHADIMALFDRAIEAAA